MSTIELLSKYDRPVPRYTSYPTAVHFHDNVTNKDYDKELSTLKSNELVSLYIHIPFCHILCHYCGCHTKVVNKYEPVRSYVQTLLKEINIVGEKLKHKMPVSQIHFGGGSPNFLESEDMEKIIHTLKKYFQIEKDTEIALEADPRLLNDQKVEALAQNGITRISLGIQDFNDEVQNAVNRIQPFKDVKQCVEGLRQVGINKINFDLMVGLPVQTTEIVKQTVEQAISLSPDRVAVFAYAHVPWMKKQQKLLEKYSFPTTQERFEMILAVKEQLERSGYNAIGIDHFAKKGDRLFQMHEAGLLRRNFQGYTDDQAETIIGFGLSSISSFKGAYFQNLSDAPKYRRKVEAGNCPISRGYILSADDIKRRKVIERVMCGYEADISAYPESLAKLSEVEADDLISLSNDKVKVTSNGWPFARITASCFDRYFVPQERQHAKAI
ncbi:MAG: oxygen-independent coproporphyrinogen III oxidase [Bdellovibrionales bacterium]